MFSSLWLRFAASFYLMLLFCSHACLKCLQIFSQANTPLKKWLLDLAFKRKIADLDRGVVRRDTIWDKLIFRKVQVDTATCGRTTSAALTYNLYKLQLQC